VAAGALAAEGFEGGLAVEAQVRDGLVSSAVGRRRSSVEVCRAAAPGRGCRRACLGRAPRGGWSWVRRKSGSGRAAPSSPLSVEAGAGGGRAAGRAGRLTAVAAPATLDAVVTMRVHPGSIWASGPWRLSGCGRGLHRRCFWLGCGQAFPPPACVGARCFSGHRGSRSLERQL
jgi:hypothetical protein